MHIGFKGSCFLIKELTISASCYKIAQFFLTETVVITPFTIKRKRTGLATVQPVIASWAFFNIDKTLKPFVVIRVHVFTFLK